MKTNYFKTTERYIVTAILNGVTVQDQVRANIISDLGLAEDKISKLRIKVSDDYFGIEDYGISTSFVEFTHGERIVITEPYVLRAAREVILSIPSEYKMVGIHFPAQDGVDLFYNENNFADLFVGFILARSPDDLNDEEMIGFLNAIFQCDTGNRVHFWREEDLGIRVTERLLKRQDLLLKAIRLLHRDIESRSDIVRLAECILSNETKSTPINKEVIEALLEKPDLLVNTDIYQNLKERI